MNEKFKEHSARKMLLKDIYQIGHVLDRKYRLLKCAYTLTAFAIIVPMIIVGLQILVN